MSPDEFALFQIGAAIGFLKSRGMTDEQLREQIEAALKEIRQAGEQTAEHKKGN